MFSGFTADQRDEALENLSVVRALLKQGKGWVKGISKTYYGPTRFCLSGAMDEANIGKYAAAEALRESIRRYAKRRGYRNYSIKDGSIVHFNDSRKTKWADVSRVLINARRLIRG